MTVLAVQWIRGEQSSVPMIAWYHKAGPTFADCLALVRRYLWRARYVVNSTPEGGSRPLDPWPPIGSLIAKVGLRGLESKPEKAYSVFASPLLFRCKLIDLVLFCLDWAIVRVWRIGYAWCALK